MKMHFYKYQGTGNDFILLDNRNGFFPVTDKNLIARLCHRRFGIGADGLILLEEDAGYDFKMVYFNADGGESTMCGNGGRCLAAFAKFLGIAEFETTFLAIDGPHKATFSDEKVYLNMKNVDAVEKRGDEYVLNTGSPHYIIFVNDINEIEVIKDALVIRNNEEFKKDGINVNFVQVVNTNTIKVRTYERGVEDETYSCGTGVVASSIAAYLQSGNISPEIPENHTSIQTPGGNLEVSFVYNKEGHFTNIMLIGPAEQIFEGELEV